MKPALVIATLALAGCDKLPIAAVIGLAPSPAAVCAMSPATQAVLATNMQTDIATLTAACEIAGQ